MSAQPTPVAPPLVEAALMPATAAAEIPVHTRLIASARDALRAVASTAHAALYWRAEFEAMAAEYESSNPELAASLRRAARGRLDM